MNTILVLTDFSDAALHAALYACSLAKQLNSSRIVLAHAFEITVPATELTPFPPQNSMVYETSMSSLRSLQDKLSGCAPSTVSFRAMNNDLVSAIEILTAEENPDLIVMGMTEKSTWEKLLLGDHSKMVVSNSKKPVLIVPHKAEIRPLIHAVLACDFQHVADTLPVEKLKDVLDDLQVSLSIVNVDSNDSHFRPDTPLETSFLHKTFATYTPTYSYVNNPDTVTGIIHFAIAEKASMIITIAKDYGFFEGLFHKSITRKLAVQSPMPVLVLQER